MKYLKLSWRILKESVSDFLSDDAMAWAAAIAFYTALSFAPLIVLLISVTSFLGDDAQQGVITEVKNVIGEQAGTMVDTVVQNADQNSSGVVPFLIGLGVTLFSASGVFGQLQLALNRIWEVRAAPGGGVMAWLKKRLLSMGMVGALAFLLLASLAVTAVLGYILPEAQGFGRVLNVVVSLVVLVPLFMLMFKFLPDAKVQWRDVLFGAIVTCVLFLVGKTLIGLYLGNMAVGSAYGAAGSLMVLLVWVYYSSIILLFGAELTQTRARVMGHRIEPEDHAIRDESAAVARRGADGSGDPNDPSTA